MTAPYLDLVRHVLDHGTRSDDRTGTGTISVFGTQTRYDLREGFPLLTTKRMQWRSIVRELLWILSGSTNARDLHPCRIWDAWADDDGELGPIYGRQWRAFVGAGGREVDQIAWLCDEIRRDPTSRRLVVSAWHPAHVDEMALPPCHVLWQVHISGGWMDLQLYQRSGDLGLGVPFNVASYSLLLAMLAHWARYRPRYFVHTIGNAHVYLNHVHALQDQLTRCPLGRPRIALPDWRPHPLDYRPGDIELVGYQCHPAIPMAVSV